MLVALPWMLSWSQQRASARQATASWILVLHAAPARRLSSQVAQLALQRSKFPRYFQFPSTMLNQNCSTMLSRLSEQCKLFFVGAEVALFDLSRPSLGTHCHLEECSRHRSPSV
mmetsp:Transcript_95617/g.308539  ORF Transcript_95617/g.308539 Transcript_95617/m.308539 type:complete len:114 (+) Transcript_95617:2126-2467(+)